MTPTPESVEQWLVQWFHERSGLSPESLRSQADANYFETGWIDSLSFVHLIADLEDAFAIQFDNEGFLDHSFATLGGLVRVVMQTLAAQRKAS